MISINIDSNSSVPMYEQIYDYIKNEIKTGNLTLQTKLPSTRNLANHLLVSRNTVDMAYAQLVSEGYIESIPKSGYYVSTITNLANIPVNTAPSVNTTETKISAYRYDFSPFAIDINSFPFNIWRKLSKNCMNDNNNDLFLLGNNQGDENLRNAIATYLHNSRSVNCRADQIIVGAGADYLLQLLAQILPYAINDSNYGYVINNESTNKADINNNVDADNKTKNCDSSDPHNPTYHENLQYNNIAMENPTYKKAYKIFSGMHYQVSPIPLDHSGISMQDLRQSDAKVVYATPSHQYPLGVVMPIKRRMELLEWANESSNRYIIEDDHDSEFRYKGKPIPSLQGIDSAGKVIYIGTFSRAIAPAIRIGYMVLPESLLNIYKKYFHYYSSTVSRVDQAIMTSFIKDGHFERHLNKMRKIYKNKHDLLIHSLKIFGDKIKIEGENAGLHLVVQFLTSVTEQELINKAEKESIKLYGLNKHYISTEETAVNITKANEIVVNETKVNETVANKIVANKIVVNETKVNETTINKTNSNSEYPTILLGYANVPEEDIIKGIELLYKAIQDILD